MANEEIDLSAPKAETLDTRLIAPAAASTLKIDPNLSDEQVLDQLLAMPQEQLLPWEEVELPSMGLYYGWTSGVVRVRPWGLGADKALSNQRLATEGKIVDKIIADHTQFVGGFDQEDLLVGDQIFLLYYLRGITHGAEYRFGITCPNPDCGFSDTHPFDLQRLVSTVVKADPGLGAEPFQITLPMLSKATGRACTVGVRFLRVRDIHTLNANRHTLARAVGASDVRLRKERRLQQQRGTSDDILNDNVDLLVVEFMGSRDRYKIKEVVKKLHQTDVAVIRRWLNEHQPGMDTSVIVKCKECGTEFPALLPITEEFFLPENPGAVRA